MMTKTRSASWTLFKVGFAMPALLLAMLIFAAGSSNILSAQDTQQKTTVDQKALNTAVTAQEDPVYEIVKEMPSYPGGTNALVQYLVTNIKYPQEARTKGIQGKVFVQYIVEKDGSVKQVKVLEGFDSECDAEAVRVVKAMPKWIPGKNDAGEPVRVQFVLPIKFSLDEKSDKKPE